TGLGLAIAYSVVQAHHGTITIADAVQGAGGAKGGRGSVFTISVPWQPHFEAMAEPVRGVTEMPA
ncbi:MAG: hypothetical protein ABF821_17390, partial [Gluconacetobacter sp.]